MYWYYSVKENGTKESKKICRLMQTDSRIYEFNDDLLSINPIEYMGRLTGESEYIFYRDIERLVDMNGGGIAIYGTVNNLKYEKMLSGADAYRYIPASVVGYEEIGKALQAVSGKVLQKSNEKGKPEMSAKKYGIPISGSHRTNVYSGNGELILEDAYVLSQIDCIQIDELARLWQTPMEQTWGTFVKQRENRIALRAEGRMKLDLSGDELSIICGPRSMQLTTDAMASVVPWRHICSNMNNEGLWRGETWKYRIPMRDIEELVVETEESSERPSPTTWWRIKGAFSATRYENLTDFLMGNGTDNEKIVNEILLKRPFVGQREYEWQDRLAEKSGLKWREP